jgi:hypothetical protein
VHLRLELDPDDVLSVLLREGDAQALLAVHPARAGGTSLLRALDTAMAEGSGECFWPARAGGIYWWIFRRDQETLEVAALWTRGGVAIWEHVFRATDAATWLHECLHAEIARIGLRTDV